MSFQEYADSFSSRMRLGDSNKKAIAGGAIAVVLAAAAIFASAMFLQQGEAQSIKKVEAETVGEQASVEGTIPASICVHVGGCVASPGVVYLDEGSRVADAIEAAGGLTGDASSDSLNLARVLSDGEQVIVASVESVSTSPAPGVEPVISQNASSSAGKVNINTATASELQQISGIGQSKAQKIVEYREAKGHFSSIDEIVNVSGIGDKTLEAIRDMICV